MIRLRLPFNRRDWLTMIAAVLVAVALGWGAYQIGLIRSQNTALANALDAQRQQVQALGQKPVAPPPGDILKNPQAAVGPPGPPGGPGPTGAAGSPGASGASGRGVASLVCINGDWRVQYTDGTVDNSAGACTGPPGTAGTPGSNGADGKDGTDGTPGADGPTGPQGPPGSDGKNGSDGQDAASWTWTDPLGFTYTCTRDDGSPDSAPTYTCAAGKPAPDPTATSKHR